MTKVPILLSEAGEGERRAAVFERLADALEREATAMTGPLDSVLFALTDAVWRGPAAVRARDELLATERRVRSAAQEVRAVAALLRRRAGDASAQSAELRRQADRLTSSTPLLA